ncbi:MAG: TRAP transporter small permease [Burkholderiaceae bacterium]|nr:TRAP transporter small permease [Burkholderiaceae bacterium]
MNGVGFRSFLDWSLTVTSAVPLFALMCLTVADVVGRYVFGKPLPGGFELTEMLLAVAVFASLPLVELREEHIAIDLLDRWYPERLRLWRRVVVYVICTVAMIAIAWQLFVKAVMVERDAMTTAVLLVPVAPVACFVASMCAVAALLLVGKVWQAALELASPK